MLDRPFDLPRAWRFRMSGQGDIPPAGTGKNTGDEDGDTMKLILDNLYQGNEHDARTFNDDQAFGIKSVINCTGNNHNYFAKEGIEYLNLYLTGETMITNTLAEQLVDFIDLRIEKHGILVYCSAGMERSLAVILVYLLSKGFTFKDALHLLREKTGFPILITNAMFYSITRLNICNDVVKQGELHAFLESQEREFFKHGLVVKARHLMESGLFQSAVPYLEEARVICVEDGYNDEIKDLDGLITRCTTCTRLIRGIRKEIARLYIGDALYQVIEDILEKQGMSRSEINRFHTEKKGQRDTLINMIVDDSHNANRSMDNKIGRFLQGEVQRAMAGKTRNSQELIVEWSRVYHTLVTEDLVFTLGLMALNVASIITGQEVHNDGQRRFHQHIFNRINEWREGTERSSRSIHNYVYEVFSTMLSKAKEEAGKGTGKVGAIE